MTGLPVAVDERTTRRSDPGPCTILQVIGSLPPDGAERFLLELVRHLDTTRYRPVVCSLSPQGALIPAFEAAGFPVVTLRKRSRWDVSIVGQLRGVLRRERPQLVHTHLFTADAWGRLAAWLHGIPTVCTAHSPDPWRNWLQRRVDGALSRVTAQVVAVSGAVADARRRREGVPAEKLTTIPNGIDLTRFGPAADTGTQRPVHEPSLAPAVVGIVGRLNAAKNHELLFDALRILVDRGRRLTLLVVGDGELRTELEARATALGLQQWVRFLGQRHDIPDVLRSLDVYVMPSHWEGMPLGLIEAMATGCPIVATAVGGIPEMVTDGQTGLLVPPGDARALAEAMGRLLDDRSLADRLGHAARIAALQHYDIRQVARAYEAVYDRILAHVQRSA